MAYEIWNRAFISFALVDGLTEGSVATIEIMTPGGVLSFMGEPSEEGRTLIVKGVHVSSEGIGPNGVGIRNLRLIAALLLEELDYDVLRIEGEARTTGAFPSHRPPPLRFARDRLDPGRS